MGLRHLCLVVIVVLSGCSTTPATESDDLSAEAAPLQLDCSAYAKSSQQKTYSWVDEEGTRHYGDRVPPEYAEKPMHLPFDQDGIGISRAGEKAEEQRATEAEAAERARQREFHLRAWEWSIRKCWPDSQGYARSNRSAELMTAQVRVIELHIRNLGRKLTELQERAKCCAPYNSDPDAPMADDSLLEEICQTNEQIERHMANLFRFHSTCPPLPPGQLQLIHDFDSTGR
jgi:hypothetical protein